MAIPQYSGVGIMQTYWPDRWSYKTVLNLTLCISLRWSYKTILNLTLCISLAFTLTLFMCYMLTVS